MPARDDKHCPKRNLDQTTGWRQTHGGSGKSHQHSAQPRCPSNTIRSDPEGLVHAAGHSAWGHNLGKTSSYQGVGVRGETDLKTEKLGPVRIPGCSCSLLGGPGGEKHTAGDRGLDEEVMKTNESQETWV